MPIRRPKPASEPVAEQPPIQPIGGKHALSFHNANTEIRKRLLAHVKARRDEGIEPEDD